jgi:hypothetical protein
MVARRVDRIAVPSRHRRRNTKVALARFQIVRATREGLRANPPACTRTLMSAKLGQYGRANELAATRTIVVPTLAVKLAAAGCHDGQADKVAVDEIRKFRVHEQPHRFPLKIKTPI